MHEVGYEGKRSRRHIRYWFRKSTRHDRSPKVLLGPKSLLTRHIDGVKSVV